jgi:hypothetical protein
MPRSRRWRHRAARIIYRAYPDQDLLPIDPPQRGESIRAFADRAQDAGDTLFLFLCREASDDIGPAEYVARLERALNDIEQVRAAFARATSAPRAQKGVQRNEQHQRQ